MAKGDMAADARRSRGSAWVPLVQHLANLPGQISADRAAGAEQQRKSYLDTQTARMNDQRLERGDQELAANDRAAQEEQHLRALFASGEPPDPQAIISLIGPERGTKLLDGLSALQKLPGAQYEEQKQLIRKALLGLQQVPDAMRAEGYPDLRAHLVQSRAVKPEEMPEQYDPAWFTAAVNYGQEPAKPQDFTLGPGQQRFNEQGQSIANVPEKPPGMREVVVRGPNGRPVKKLVSEAEMMRGVEQYQEPRAAVADNEPLQSIIGPDGKPVLVRRGDAVGKTPASGTSKPASGLEKRALAFFNRAAQADKDLEEMEPEIQKKGLAGQTYMQWAPNVAQTELGQQYTQAQRAFTEARLRKDSGAAIPDHEFDNDRRTYFAQPGDSPDTLKQKRRGRAAVLASLSFESGQALGEFLGDADEAQTVVEGYKTRSAKPGQPRESTDVKVDPLGIR